MTKRFGFWTLTFLVVANMIGAGVFTTSGFALGDLRSPHIVLLAWVVGGLIATAGAFSYGMLAKAMPESGGEYLFLSRATHPILGYIAGWVSLISGFSGAIAFAASAFEGYVFPERVRPAWLPSGALASGVIILAGAFHGLRPRVGAIAQNTVVLFKLGLLAVLLLFAATKLGGDDWSGLGGEGTDLEGWALISAFAGSLVWISLSYSGFNAAVYVTEEARTETVARSLVVGTVLVTILYVLLNAIFVYAPPASSIIGKEDVAAIAAESLGGAGFATFVRGVIAAGLLTSVFSMMMAAPRVYAKMAEDGLMPKFLRFQGDAPRGATVAQIAIALLFVLISTLQGLLSYLGLTLSLSAAFSACCLVLPSVRKRPLWHPIHLIPAFYIGCTLTAAAIRTTSNPWELVGTLLTFAFGALAYLLVRGFGTKAPHKESLVTKSATDQ